MCCCKERCVARRGKHDPVQVLFGRRMMIVKVREDTDGREGAQVQGATLIKTVTN
jgi:hypothetical protein